MIIQDINDIYCHDTELYFLVDYKLPFAGMSAIETQGYYSLSPGTLATEQHSTEAHRTNQYAEGERRMSQEHRRRKASSVYRLLPLTHV